MTEPPSPGRDHHPATPERAEGLVKRARETIETGPNRFLNLLEAGAAPRDRLAWLAGEQYNILLSDRRSFALVATRFPRAPAGDMFLALSQGEGTALELLRRFAAALGLSEGDLRAYEPRPLAQAYPACLAQLALSGSVSAVALAMLANLDEWGGYCGRAGDALVARYGLAEEAVSFFRFFAEPPPGFADQAAEVIARGLDAGDDPDEALRAARRLHAYETSFWDALAEGI